MVRRKVASRCLQPVRPGGLAQRRGITIRNCLRFAEQHGCGVLRICNLFSRKDYPDGETREPLPDPPDPVEVRRENDRHLAAEIAKCQGRHSPLRLGERRIEADSRKTRE